MTDYVVSNLRLEELRVGWNDPPPADITVLEMCELVEGLEERLAEQKAIVETMVAIETVAMSGKPLISNQGQAMDGYTMLAEFRSLAREVLESQRKEK